MGEDPGLWYSNWHHASPLARQLIQEVKAVVADGSDGSEVMPLGHDPERIWRFPHF